ncbi:MAG: hypothetical protein M3Z06_08795 [Actinomycetota bacterium]|nr:hypothetical protein [Actinomycetota bacterium]
MEDVAIQALLSRLARPHKSGGKVVERAAILAEGADFPAVLAWITAHAGEPETTAAVASSRGLHGPRDTNGGGGPERAPHRYVLPTGALV